MKERILQWLKSFTKEDYQNNDELKGIQKKLKESGISVSLETLHERSQKVLDFILHHYSTLNIGTIDKFNSKLIRNFSYELGLPHQFNLEIQNEPYLIEAVDRLLDKIGEDRKISDAFMDLVNYNMENEERTNINATLYKRAKTYLKDVHYDEMKKNEDFDWKAYEDTKKNIRKKIAENKKQAENIASKSLELIQENHLEIKDFSGGSTHGIAVFFSKYLEFVNGRKNTFPLPLNEENALDNFRKVTSSKDASVKQRIESILEELIENRQKIIRLYISQIKNEEILKELLPFKFNKEIQDQLTLIEEENDLVLLSKFNIMINENLKNEPSEFIYEKIGTKFHHYFIDEFQDTSKMQWENLIPLRDHTISSENHSFTIVGDPKQSIYRFRGGDSEIMLNILNRKESVNIPVTIENLEYNWRSASNIVEFNNALYRYISSMDLSEQHRDLFSEKAHQTAAKKNTGRVKINLTEHGKDILFFENSSEQMHHDIQQCIDNGFSFSDIAILCRKGDEIKEYASLLGSKKITENGKEKYIKTISEKGLTLGISKTLKALIEYLRWNNDPKNLQFPAKFLYYLNELGRIKMKDFTEETIQILSKSTKHLVEKEIETQYDVKLRPENALQLNLYNYIEYYLNEFCVEDKETDYLLTFLETIYNYTQNPGASLKDFLHYWDEEANKISVQAADNIDAIKIMTIHSAKGLEFPVVFLPIKNNNMDSKFEEWLPLEGTEKLKSINLNAFKKDLEVYDDEIREFNETNSYKNRIDRLCILYVATTRASEQLFVYLQQPSEKGTISEFNAFIKNEFPSSENEYDLFPEKDFSFRKQNQKQKNQHMSRSIHLHSEEITQPTNLVVATPSKNYQNTIEHVRNGIFAHEILSQINTSEDVEKVLEKYFLEGTISKSELNNIRQRISAVVQHPDYSRFFRKGQKILNEKDIMICENGLSKIYRPDRIIESEGGYFIIDFKTGNPKEEDLKQVEKYSEILTDLGKKVIETKVIYL